MLRLLITCVVLCAALFGVQRAAEAHGACCGADPAEPAAVQVDGAHRHHQTHDAPHVPHDEPDGCHHVCSGCMSVAPTLLPPAIPLLLPAPACAGAQRTTAERTPIGPPPNTPFQVPRS